MKNTQCFFILRTWFLIHITQKLLIQSLKNTLFCYMVRYNFCHTITYNEELNCHKALNHLLHLCLHFITFPNAKWCYHMAISWADPLSFFRRQIIHHVMVIHVTYRYSMYIWYICKWARQRDSFLRFCWWRSNEAYDQLNQILMVSNIFLLLF